jgi:hypothetical protein
LGRPVVNDGNYCIARKLLKVARLKEARRWWWYCIRVRMENTYGDVEESHSGIRRVVLRNAVQWVHAPDAPSAYLTITRSRGARASIFRLKRPCSSHLSSFHHRPLAQPNRPQQASSITWIIQHHQMRRNPPDTFPLLFLHCHSLGTARRGQPRWLTTRHLSTEAFHHA